MKVLALVALISSGQMPRAGLDLMKDVPPPQVLPKPRSVARAIRVAVMELRVDGEVAPRPLAALKLAIAPELRKLEGISALGAEEVRDMLSMERQKQMVGCSEDSASCLAEIAGALDADELVSVQLMLVGKTYTLSAQRSDMRVGKVVQSQSKRFEQRDGEELLGVVGPLIEGLYPERPLKPGRTRGIEEQAVRRLNPPPLPKWVIYGTSGMGAIALAGGATFTVMGVETRRMANETLQAAADTPVQPAEVLRLEQQLKSQATARNVLFGVAGAAALAAGVQFFFTDWNDDRAALQVGPGGIAVSGTF